MSLVASSGASIASGANNNTDPISADFWWGIEPLHGSSVSGQVRPAEPQHGLTVEPWTVIEPCAVIEDEEDELYEGEPDYDDDDEDWDDVDDDLDDDDDDEDDDDLDDDDDDWEEVDDEDDDFSDDFDDEEDDDWDDDDDDDWDDDDDDEDWD